MPHSKWTNPEGILFLPCSGTANPRQVATFSRRDAVFDASFAASERGRPVFAFAFAVFGQGISSIGDARLFFGEGIAASCRGVAALAEAMFEPDQEIKEPGLSRCEESGDVQREPG
jgi:hypothetical protein